MTMLEYLKKEANVTYTENGAVTNRSTGSCCLDLFATIGALRQAEDKEINERFRHAYNENPEIAMKLLFFGRDIREGLGERRTFRTAFTWLAKEHPDSVKKNIRFVAEYGRFDDLLSLMDTPCEKEMLDYLKEQFEEDLLHLETGGSISLLGKWLPSANASSRETVRNAKKVIKAFGMTEAVYRKATVALRKKIHIIENDLRVKEYSFDYEKMPSRALYKYREAFLRNDTERYNGFLDRVLEGETKLHSDNVSPYELIDPYLKRVNLNRLSEEQKKALNATWKSFADYTTDENAIVVVDTSGSMYCYCNPMPASVALSLGLYFGERNKGVFKEHFIMFSENPRLIEIKGETFVDKLRYVTGFCEIGNTNLEAVFKLILNAAVKNHVPQEDLPSRIIIVSDMEFDFCVRDASWSNYENAKKDYKEHGYELPHVVFWNVASRNRQQPVTENDQGTTLVSGVTPKLFHMIASGETSPYQFMLEVIDSARYEKISA